MTLEPLDDPQGGLWGHVPCEYSPSDFTKSPPLVLHTPKLDRVEVAEPRARLRALER